MTFTWLGTIRAPGQFVLFWSDMLVIRVAGALPTIVVNDAVRCRSGPMTIADATPVATPALSPFERGTVVSMLCAGVHM